MTALAIVFPADHPAAAGHFPGNPIVPGAALLAEALQAVGRDARQDLSTARVASAKFPSPARPGERIDVEYSVSAARFAIQCAVGGRTVLKAEVTCGARTPGK